MKPSQPNPHTWYMKQQHGAIAYSKNKKRRKGCACLISHDSFALRLQSEFETCICRSIHGCSTTHSGACLDTFLIAVDCIRVGLKEAEVAQLEEITYQLSSPTGLDLKLGIVPEHLSFRPAEVRFDFTSSRMTGQVHDSG